jgi:hypothetical protein
MRLRQSLKGALSPEAAAICVLDTSLHCTAVQCSSSVDSGLEQLLSEKSLRTVVAAAAAAVVAAVAAALAVMNT